MTPENESIFLDFCARNVLRGLIVHLDLVPTPSQMLHIGVSDVWAGSLTGRERGSRGDVGEDGPWMVSYNWSTLAWVMSHSSLQSVLEMEPTPIYIFLAAAAMTS